MGLRVLFWQCVLFEYVCRVLLAIRGGTFGIRAPPTVVWMAALWMQFDPEGGVLSRGL